jgi:hypothetical protein
MDKQLYRKAERLLEKEIREQVENDSLTMDSLEIMYKVLDNIKDIYIICAMKREEDENEYSERMYYDDESYARGRGRYSNRDSRGRYSGRGSYEDGSYDRGYSNDMDYDRMMSNAKSENERELIRQLMEARKN